MLGPTQNQRKQNKTMKTSILTIGLASLLTFTGCSSPQARHDVRVERRTDVVDHTGARIDNRQDNRYDRRTDRVDRVDTRYGY